MCFSLRSITNEISVKSKNFFLVGYHNAYKYIVIREFRKWEIK